MEKQPGKIVKTKSGKIGRTFNAKGVMNGKVPVFLVESVEQPTGRSENDRFVKYAATAMLCDPAGLVVIGEIG